MKKIFKDLSESLTVKIVVLFLIISVSVYGIAYLGQAISWGYTKIWPLDSNVLASHDEHLELVLEDFSNLSQISNVDVHIGEQQIELVFNDEQCDLKVVADKELNIISREVIDNRSIADPIKVVVWLIVLPILAVALLLIVYVVYCFIAIVVKELFQQCVKRIAKRKAQKRS